MNSFDKPIGEWIEEEIDIPVLEPVLKGDEVVGIKHTTRKATQKTMYTHAPETKVSCADQEHDWFIPDKHDHTAHCRKCLKRKLIRAVYEKVVDGKIVDRESGAILE